MWVEYVQIREFLLDKFPFNRLKLTFFLYRNRFKAARYMTNVLNYIGSYHPTLYGPKGLFKFCLNYAIPRG